MKLDNMYCPSCEKMGCFNDTRTGQTTCKHCDAAFKPMEHLHKVVEGHNGEDWTPIQETEGMNGWMPLNTAPTDGREVLILNSGGFIDIGRYLDISGADSSLPKPSYRWRGGPGELYGRYSIYAPVYWQPLPDLPTNFPA